MPKKSLTRLQSAVSDARRLAVVYRPIAELTPDPKNARVHSRKQIRQIANSIEAFGFNVPILVDRDGRVMAGHGRLQACKELGRAEVPTIVLDHLSDAQRRAFMLADNRLAEIATWDDHQLAEQLRDLSVQNLSFDIEATGFEIGRIDLAIASLDEKKKEAEPSIERVSGARVARVGDLWRLGRHRLLCANALEEASWKQLMSGQAASLVCSDPPYNVKIDGHVSGLGQVRHREFGMAAGELSEAEFVDFLTSALTPAARACRAGAAFQIFMDWRHMREILAAADAVGLELLNLCVWTKANAGMGSLYRSQHELVFVFRKPGGAHRNNIDLGRHGRNRTNVWAYAAGPGFGRAGEEGALAALHPTVKPVQMIVDAILDCTARGDIVVDGFLGSGTTLIAAERTGRRCFGMELDPLYVDLIIRRFQNHSGEAARLVETGQTFAELESSARLSEGK